MNLKKGVLFAAIALLPILSLCLEAVLLVSELSVYGAVDWQQGLSFGQRLLHWGITCFIWGMSALGIAALSKRYGFDMLACYKKPAKKQMLLLVILIIAGIVFMCSTWEFRFKPLVELTNFRGKYGVGGIAAFFFQYLYYLFECILIVMLVALSQYAVETFFPYRAVRYIPVGGIFCALTWGMLHGITKDFETAVLCIVLSSLFGISYLLTGRNIKYAYMAVALIFLL